MNDWYGTAKAIIRQTGDVLPEGTDLATRRKAILAAKPHEFACTSWGKKTWARAQREYLVKFGYVPKNAKAIPLLSPLERQKARSLAL